MTKEEVQKRVLKNGKPLDLALFSWDEETKTFSSDERELVLAFGLIDDCTFNTGSNCIFYTGSNCTFNTGSNCIFKTRFHCTFNTYSNCTFETEEQCVVIRRDIYEVIELQEKQKIKLRGHQVKGFDVITDVIAETITIEGKEYTLNEIKKALKKQV